MIGALPTLAGVMLVASIVVAPIALLTVGSTRPTVDSIPYLAVAGLGNVFGLLFVYTGLRAGKVGIVGALAASEGAIAAVLALLAGEALVQVEVIGIAVVGIGVVLAAFGPDPAEEPGSADGRPSRSTARAIAFGALAGLAFGVSLYSTGRLGADLAIGWAILPPRIVGLALITLPLIATRRFHITRTALPFVVVSGTGEVGGSLAVAWGAQAGIAVTSALAAQFATVAALVAWLFLGERLGPVQWGGVGAVAVGVVLLALGAA